MGQPIVKEYALPRGIAISTLQAGKGAPVIFIHGAGGLMWDPFLDALAERNTVIAPHLPGTGGSRGLENIRDMWDLIVTYQDLLDAIGLDRVDLIGHSMGGMIGFELAIAESARVRKIAAIAPAGLFSNDHPIPDFFSMAPEELIAHIVHDTQSPLAKMMLAMPDNIDEKVNFIIDRVSTMAAATKFLWPIPDRGLVRRLHRVKVPTLLLWGKQDRLVPAAYADDFKRGIPQARIEMIDQASHMVQLEQLEKCLKIVGGFLAAT
jgi:pimeloyl-ACP methyl ester carboxylesterase